MEALAGGIEVKGRTSGNEAAGSDPAGSA